MSNAYLFTHQLFHKLKIYTFHDSNWLIQNSELATFCKGLLALSIFFSSISLGYSKDNPTTYLEVNAGSDQYQCLEYNGTQYLSAQASGGTAPYTYFWGDDLGYGKNKTVGQTETRTFWVEVTDAYGRTAKDDVTIFINGPKVDVGPNQYYCQYDGAQYLSAEASGGTAPYTYFWGDDLGYGKNKTVGQTQTRTFWVEVTDANGCKSKDDMTIFIGDDLKVATTPDQRYCQYEPGTQRFSAQGTGGTEPYSYEWSNGLGAGQYKTSGSTSTSTFTVTVTDANGCTATDDITIFVEGVTVATTPDQRYCQYEPGTQRFSAQGTGGTEPYSYEWSNGLGAGQYKTSGSTSTSTFTVTVTDANGCTATDDITIFVGAENCAPCELQGGDTDGDGVCNNDDCAPNDSNFPKPAGTACNDGNPNTVNDRIQANGCDCAGTFDACATRGGDTDGDGVCNDDDCAPNDSNFPKPAGTACNDGNPNTVNDRIQANGCDCAGTFDACATRGGDTDGDGVCNNDDCAPNDSNFPKPAGTACNDGNPNTVNDRIQANGCDCAGTFDACATRGGDTDGDGVCNNDDCAPNDSNFPKPAGTACNDGNPNTVNDRIQANGCDCAGDISANASIGNQVFNDANNNGRKDDGEGGIDGVEVKLLQNNGSVLARVTTNNGGFYSFNNLQSGSYVLMFGTPNGFTASPRTGFGDNDVDNNSDNNPNNGNMTDPIFLSPGENNGTIDAGFFAGMICDNLNFGGKIGFNNVCSGSVDICGASGVASTINSCELPSGGSGTIEYIWLSNQISCDGPTGTVAQMIANPNAYNWKIVPNATSATYSPGVLSTSTCYLRCARRAGCSTYIGESNIVRIDVNPNCGNNNTGGETTESCGGGTSITYGNGAIKMNGGSFYQVLDASWNEVFNCGWQCGDAQTATGLGAGTYRVYIKNSDYQVVCEKVITLSESTDGSNPIDADCNLAPGTIERIGCGEVNVNITYGNNSISLIANGSGAELNYSIYDASGQQVQGCNTGCGRVGALNGTPAGNYRIVLRNTNGEIICEEVICVSPVMPTTPVDPDNDGDGVVASQDCNDNDANLTTIGATCNDGNPNTTNDRVQDNCNCAGTPSNNTGGQTTESCGGGTSITYGNGAIKMDGGSFYQILDASWNEVFNCGWQCGDTQTASGLGAGTYRVYIKNSDYQVVCEKVITLSESTGGSNPIDADCNLAPGTVERAGCGEVNVTITYGNNSISLIANGSGAELNYSIYDASGQQVQGCEAGCGRVGTLNGTPAGNYRVVIRNANGEIVCEEVICVSPVMPTTPVDPDNDGDGVVASQDCNDNDANITTIGAACNDGNPNTTDDKVQDNCDCAGTPSNNTGGQTIESCGGGTSITYGNGSIKMDGGSFYQILDASWNEVFNCGWQCGDTQTASGLGAGTYRVYIKNSDYQVVCEKVITLSESTGGNAPDNDGDGVVASQDCNDNDANLTTIGATCNDGNPNTTNDKVQNNCNCAGTPSNNNTGAQTESCGEITITFDNGRIHMAGQQGKSYYFKINDMNNGWSQLFGCGWNCGHEQTATNVPNGRYLVTISNSDWSKHCDIEVEMTNSNYSQGAGSRNAPQLNFDAYNDQRTVDLQWLTNSGYKVAQFEIERSTDGEHFETLQKSINKDWTTQLAYHQTTDLTPSKGANFYRVKEVYLDGSFTYTNIKQVGFYIDLENLSIYPNPVVDVLNLNLKPVIGKTTDIYIINAFGQVLQSRKLGIVGQESIQIELNKSIPNGFYQVLIEVEGHKSVAKKLVVKRFY